MTTFATDKVGNVMSHWTRAWILRLTGLTEKQYVLKELSADIHGQETAIIEHLDGYLERIHENHC